MHIRQVTLKSLDPEDYSRLPNFVHSLRTHSMYKSIVDAFISTPGFIKKESIIRESKEGQFFLSLIFFEDKESFDNVINDETFQGIHIYLELMCTQEGISYEIKDYEEY